MHKASLRHALRDVPENAQLIIDGTKSNFIDEDIIETIEDFIEMAKSKQIAVDVVGIKLKEQTL